MQVDEYNPFEDLLVRFRASLDRLVASGVRIAVTSRLRRYERLLETVIGDSRPAAEASTVAALAFALREIDEIIEIVTHLPAEPYPELIGLLSLLPGGADLPDDDATARAREAQYELYLGAVFRRAGLRAVHGHPDLTVSYLAQEYLIEAKRPGTRERLDDRVRSAVRQCRATGKRGTIAISLDQIIRPPGSVLQSSSFQSIAPTIARLVQEFISSEMATFRRRLAGEPVMALLFTARVPARLDQTGHLVLGTSIHLEPLVAEGSPEREFLRATTKAYLDAQTGGAA